MGICISLPPTTDSDDVDNGSNEEDSEGMTEEDETTDSSEDLEFTSQSSSIPEMVTKEHFVRRLHDTSCYWVYASFTDSSNIVTQRFFALDIKENGYVRLPRHPMDKITENLGSVLDYKLYVIGGRRGPFFSRVVHFFDPVLHNWYDSTITSFTRVTRAEALAVSARGRIYVFGLAGKWAEVYKPSTRTWTSIPKSKILTSALTRGLSPLRASAVLGNKIILRGSRIGLAFDVMSKSWTPVSDNLIRSWCDCTSAAAVQNMLISCHVDESQPGTPQRSIRAYDPDEDVWLMLEGIDSSFHENAHRSQFMSINGKLVIYHMWEQNDLRFSVIQIDERLQTTVRASLLWQTLFPIATIINQGLNINPERLRGRVYTQNLLIRADV